MRRVPALIPELPRDAWTVLGGVALSAVGSGLTLPFFFVYLSRVRGIDVELAGLALSTIALAGFVGNPLGGSLSDRVGPRIAFVVGLLTAAVGAVAVAFVTLPWHGFGAAALVGLGAAIFWPSEDSLLASLTDPEQRSSVFSVRHAVLNAGFGVGMLAASLIADISRPESFQLLYLLDAATFVAFVPILLRLRVGDRPRGKDAEGESAGGYRDVFRDRIFRRVWVLAALLVAVGFGQMNGAFAAYATGAGGLSAGALSIAFAANTFTVVVAQLITLKLMEGRRRTRGVMLLAAFWAGAWAVTLLAGNVGGGGAAAIALFSISMALFAIGETLLSPTVAPMVNDLAPEHLRGRYNGTFALAWTTGFMVGPAVAGFALGAGFDDGLFGGLVVGCGVVAVLALRLERHVHAAVNLVHDPEKDIAHDEAAFAVIDSGL